MNVVWLFCLHVGVGSISLKKSLKICVFRLYFNTLQKIYHVTHDHYFCCFHHT